MPESRTPVSLPVLGQDAVTFVHSYRKVPMVGLCRLDGRTHYFTAHRRAAESTRPLVFPLSVEEAEREELLQTLYELHVGTHRSPGLPASEKENLPEAYDRYAAAVSEAFPEMDVYARNYASRPPVAVLDVEVPPLV